MRRTRTIMLGVHFADAQNANERTGAQRQLLRRATIATS
jgi:hypothetical protein